MHQVWVPKPDLYECCSFFLGKLLLSGFAALALSRLARTIARLSSRSFVVAFFCSVFAASSLAQFSFPRWLMVEDFRPWKNTLRYNNSNSAGVGGGSDGDAPPVPAVAPVSYNSVAPPMSEFELAKQRAELIAARLVTGAELKRPRTEESSEEQQQQQQQNGADRSNGSDFDQAYPGNSRNWTCVMSFAAPELPMCWNQTHHFACLVLVLFLLLLLNLYQSEASSFTSVLRVFFFFF
jgi:hypothetical protein